MQCMYPSGLLRRCRQSILDQRHAVGAVVCQRDYGRGFFACSINHFDSVVLCARAVGQTSDCGIGSTEVNNLVRAGGGNRRRFARLGGACHLGRNRGSTEDERGEQGNECNFVFVHENILLYFRPRVSGRLFILYHVFCKSKVFWVLLAWV